jgi:translation initiation factor 1 (eIF-1/SUI1)
MIKVDETLKAVLKGQKQHTVDSLISFEDLFNALFQQFTPMHYIVHKYPDNKEREDPVLKKGRFRPVEFKLEARGGNKKLTTISNLDEFSIDAKELQQKLRTSLGCSTNIDNVAAGANTTDAYVVTVQGNQIHLLSELLKSKFFSSTASR